MKESLANPTRGNMVSNQTVVSHALVHVSPGGPRGAHAQPVFALRHVVIFGLYNEEQCGTS